MMRLRSRLALGALLLLTFVGAEWPASRRVAAQGPLFREVTCDASAAISGNTAATAQLVALAAGQRIVICGVVFNGAGATTAKLVRGTGANCGTGTADLTGAMTLATGSTIAIGGGSGTIARLPVGEALCWTNSGAVQVSGLVTFARL